MLGWVIAASIRHRLLVAIGTLALIGFGWRAYQQLPIDAVPHQGWIEITTTNPAEMDA